VAHFMIFSEYAHPHVYLLSASSVREAVRNYGLEDGAFEECNGLLINDVYPGRAQIFSCELQAIECWERSIMPWSIKQLKDEDWSAPLAQVYSSETPSDLKKYVALCREQFGSQHDLPRKAFVWPLRDGPLVTFYRQRKKYGPIRPEAIGQRFIIPWATWPKVVEWKGGYDTILEELVL